MMYVWLVKLLESKLWGKIVWFHVIVSKNSWINPLRTFIMFIIKKNSFYFIFLLRTLWTVEVFTTRFNTRRQVVTPLLYWHMHDCVVCRGAAQISSSATIFRVADRTYQVFQVPTGAAHLFRLSKLVSSAAEGCFQYCPLLNKSVRCFLVHLESCRQRVAAACAWVTLRWCGVGGVAERVCFAKAGGSRQSSSSLSESCRVGMGEQGSVNKCTFYGCISSDIHSWQ